MDAISVGDRHRCARSPHLTLPTDAYASDMSHCSARPRFGSANAAPTAHGTRSPPPIVEAPSVKTIDTAACRPAGSPPQRAAQQPLPWKTPIANSSIA